MRIYSPYVQYYQFSKDQKTVYLPLSNCKIKKNLGVDDIISVKLKVDWNKPPDYHSGINSGGKEAKKYVQTMNSNVRGRWTPYVAQEK